MGSAASLLMDRKVYLTLIVALPVLAWITPPQFALLFTVLLVCLTYSSLSMHGKINDDQGMSTGLAGFRKQLYGMMVIVGTALIVMAMVTYAKMRGVVVGPEDGNTELIGLYNGYRGFRLGYAIIITVFSIAWGLLQTQRTFATNDPLELTKMQHAEDIWVGNHGKNVMGSMVTLWTTTLLMLAIAPSSLAQNLKPLMSTLGDLRMAAGATV